MGAEDSGVQCRITGRVQGVGFRYFICEHAIRLRLRGHVRNKRDGSLEIAASGPTKALQELIELAGRGPYGARVDRCDVSWGAADPHQKDFDVRY